MPLLRRMPALLALLSSPVVAQRRPAPPTLGPRDAAELMAVVDSVVGVAMARDLIPGVVFVFVRDGEIVAKRGYGAAHTMTGWRVEPDSTLWRIGSISKVFTATAVMQLVERGELRLDRDVNRYLQGVRVPPGAAPITVGQLLDHTSGLDELPGRLARDSASVLPLADFLRDRLVRAQPSGLTPSYSSYGMALAGLLVVQRSGMTFERYLAERIFKPLGMTRTAIRLNDALRDALSPGYEPSRTFPPTRQAYEWYHTTPASSINATATDMARFMIAHLQGGGTGDAHIMKRATTKAMHATSARGHPQVPGVARGLFEGDYAGVRILEHGGSMAGQASAMVLLPEHRAGFFIAHHFSGNALRDSVKYAILDRFYAREVKPRAAVTMSRAELERFAGTYRWSVYCRSCGTPAPTRGPAVTVHDDGTIGFAGQRWRPIGPLLFQRVDGKRVLGFRADSAKRVTHLFIDGALTFERIP